MTVIDHPPQCAGMLMGISGCAPDTGQTKFPAPARQQIFRAVHLSPGVMTAGDHQPAMRFGVTQCRLDLFVGMPFPCHIFSLS